MEGDFETLKRKAVETAEKTREYADRGVKRFAFWNAMYPPHLKAAVPFLKRLLRKSMPGLPPTVRINIMHMQMIFMLVAEIGDCYLVTDADTCSDTVRDECYMVMNTPLHAMCFDNMSEALWEKVINYLHIFVFGDGTLWDELVIAQNYDTDKESLRAQTAALLVARILESQGAHRFIVYRKNRSVNVVRTNPAAWPVDERPLAALAYDEMTEPGPCER